MTEWRSMRLKHLAAEPIRNGVGEAAQFGDPSWPRYVRTTDIGGPRALRSDTIASLPPELARSADVRRGDILMSAAGTVGRTLLYTSNTAACYAGYLVRFRPGPQVHPGFLSYWTETPAFQDQVEVGKVRSTIDNFSAGKYQNVLVRIPDLSRQWAIANYLDTETARIDALITKKQRLRHALRERERVLIEHRLHAAADGVIAFRRLLSAPPQYGAAEAGAEGEGDWPRYIRITDLRSNGSLREDDVMRLAPDIARPFLLHDGDLLFARSGATAGKAFRYSASMGASCFAGYLIRFQVDRARCLPELVELWSQTSHYWGQIVGSTVQSTIQNVNADRYLSLLVPHIPRPVQADVVEGLTVTRRRVAKVDQVIGRQIALLREHRQALITAAVTGELEIPGVAA